MEWFKWSTLFFGPKDHLMKIAKKIASLIK